MKLLQISFLILLPISLLSQEANKFEIADSIIDIKEIMNEEFSDDMIQRIEEINAIGSEYSTGILELDNVLEKMENKKVKKLPGTCQCHMMMGKLEIANSIGFMAGIANVIEVNLADSTYQSKIYYSTDGMKMYKFKPDNEFIENIEVVLEESRLEISPDSKFEHNEVIKGKLTGTSIKYYKQDYSDRGYKKIQTKVLSIFECKLQNHEQMMIDMGMEDELEKIKEGIKKKMN